MRTLHSLLPFFLRYDDNSTVKFNYRVTTSPPILLFISAS